MLDFPSNGRTEPKLEWSVFSSRRFLRSRRGSVLDVRVVRLPVRSVYLFSRSITYYTHSYCLHHSELKSLATVPREYLITNTQTPTLEHTGTCYRLFTEDAFETELRKVAVPEIQRCNLCTVILQLKAAGIEDVSSFDFIDPPSSGAIL